MNERLHDMMMKATEDMPQGYYVPGEYFEKFAELIVRECIDIVEHSRIEGDEGVCLVGATKCKIKHHFGVEYCL
jgi:hypothetical protein